MSVTQDPYGYAANDPVNNTDPTGLYCLTGKNPNGSCRSISRGASRAGRKAVDATGDAVAASPPGQVLSGASRLTGLTLGPCLNGSIFGGYALDGSLCYQATPDGDSGFTVTTGGGLGFPVGGSVSGSFQVSNAQRMSDLSGPFGYVTGSVGEGVLGTA